jgi:ATP-binding cassette subfamily B protein AbcA/BmrA
MGKQPFTAFRRPKAPPVTVRSGDTAQGQLQNRGIWRRFFHTCAVAHIPYLTLLFYIVLNTVYSTLVVYIPEVNANFFTGDASVQSIAMFLGAELLSTALSQAMLYVKHVFRARTNRNLRNVLWGKILRLKPSYFDRVSANTLLSRITVDADCLNTVIMDIVLYAFFLIYMLVLTLREMSSISLQAAIWLMIFTPVFFLFSFVVGRLNLRFESNMKFKMADLTDYLSELMASLPIIKSFNRQDYEERRGKAVINDYYTANRNVIVLDVAQQIVSAVIGMIPDVAIILMGIQMLQNSTLTAAGWYVFYIYSGTLITFASNMGGLWQQSKAVQGQLNKISSILAEEEEGLGSYIQAAVASGDLVFDRVSFDYDGTPALQQVSFTVPENQTTALVGYSGAGKSTVIKLLERFYAPEEGHILLHGADLGDYDLKTWRSKIALVSQNTPMISGTIRENLLYGVHRPVTDQEIMAAAKLAYVDDLINSCPEGLEHPVGQFGSKLSGGQRQKLAIARAILMETDYLILDEPTASLDVISAEEVAKAVEGLQHRTTILLVAHQPRVLRNVDHVVVLNQDHTAVEGSPAELMERSDFFAALMQGEEAAQG